MKIVITGASGNVGTAILRQVAHAEDIDHVVGVVRRAPHRMPPPPYNHATWLSLDVGGPSDARVVTVLAAAMDEADAVVHLSWAVQPNHDRERLRRTNVLGMHRVLAAARAAQVPHVVVASSVGAYSPAVDETLHDESWPTGGIDASDYSVDKAAVERILDAHEREHPETLITRLRPALIFQRDVGSEIQRYFIGSLVPPRLLDGHLPLVPWPSATRVQAVHADDVARAYLAAVRKRPGGAVNIAADDSLGGAEIASILAGGRWREVPRGAVRAAVSAAWTSRLVPVSPGWVDMAAHVPLMATERARDVLDWRPEHSALETVAEVVRGIADGAGTASPPLRRR